MSASEKRPGHDGDGTLQTTEYSLVGLLRRHSARNYSTYHPPAQDVVDRVFELMHELDAAPSLTPDVLASAFEKGFDVIATSEDPELYMFDPRNKRAVHVGFLWRFGKVWVPRTPKPQDPYVMPLILESPHEGSDNATGIFAQCILENRARCAFYNTIAPDCGSGNHREETYGATDVPLEEAAELGTDEAEAQLAVLECPDVCSVADPDDKDGDERGNQGRPGADGAHRTNTLFHKVHCEFARMYPFAAFGQIHGMVGAPNFQILMTACFRGDFPRVSIARFVAIGLAESLSTKEQKNKVTICSTIRDLVDGKPVALNDGNGSIFRARGGCHNTTVQAHALNGGGAWSVGTRDTGRFVHVETGAQIRMGRRSDNFRKAVAKAFALAMDRWVLCEIDTGGPRAPKEEEEA